MKAEDVEATGEKEECWFCCCCDCWGAGADGMERSSRSFMPPMLLEDGGAGLEAAGVLKEEKPPRPLLEDGLVVRF